MQIQKYFKTGVWLFTFALLSTGIQAQTERDKTKTKPVDPAKTSTNTDSRSTNNNNGNAYTWSTDADKWFQPGDYSYYFPRNDFSGDNAMKKDFGTRDDRAPLYRGDCPTGTDPYDCSKAAIRNAERIRYPAGTSATNRNQVEYVIFNLDENGKVVGGYQVAPQAYKCESCAQAAVDAVTRMNTNWQPAMRGGKEVPSTVSVPVWFSDDDK